MAAYFGIHVGATNSCVAVSKDEKTVVLANDAGDRVTPTIVSFSDGELSVGFSSNRNPANVMTHCKRLIGHDKVDSDDLVEVMKHIPCKIVALGEELAYELSSDSDGKMTTKKIRVQQALELIFQQLMVTATSHSGIQGKRYAVLSVPTQFTSHQKDCMRKAASSAGFCVLQVIHEPSAALLAYQIGQENGKDMASPSNSMQTCLVYRVGGLSLDATVLRVHNGLYRILTTVHRDDLGGDILTDLLVEHLSEELKRHFRITEKLSARSVHKLRTAAENCKRVLSTVNTTTCSVESVHDGMDFSCTVSRARLDALLTNIIPKFLQPLGEVLSAAQLKVEDINKVVICGGSCKIPRLQQELSSYFQAAQIMNHFPPDEVLAIGAANQAACLRGYEDDVISADIHRDTGFMLPTITRDVFYKNCTNGTSHLIFQEGTPIPAFNQLVVLQDKSTGSGDKEEEEENSSSVVDNKTITLEIYESGKKETKCDERSLGKITLRNPEEGRSNISDKRIVVTSSFRANKENEMEVGCSENVVLETEKSHD